MKLIIEPTPPQPHLAMDADSLINAAEALIQELRERRTLCITQNHESARLYAWLCVMAARHGEVSPAWASATRGLTLTMTDQERETWKRAEESWLSDDCPGYLRGAKDITLPCMSGW